MPDSCLGPWYAVTTNALEDRPCARGASWRNETAGTTVETGKSTNNAGTALHGLAGREKVSGRENVSGRIL